MLAFYFHKADYPTELIQGAFERALLKDRMSLLSPKSTPNVQGEEQAEKDLFLITKLHPFFNDVNSFVSKNWNLLASSSSTRPLMEANLTRVFRRAKNIPDHLVRAKISPIPDHPAIPTLREYMHSKTNECPTRRCSYCSTLDTTGRIMSTATAKENMTCKKITCRSPNLVYCLHCNACG